MAADRGRRSCVVEWPTSSRMTPAHEGAMVARMPQPPALTPEQRQAALDKAAKVRRERAEVKEKLKMGSHHPVGAPQARREGRDRRQDEGAVGARVASRPRQGQGPPADGDGGDQREPPAAGPRCQPARRSADAHREVLILVLSGPGGAGRAPSSPVWSSATPAVAEPVVDDTAAAARRVRRRLQLRRPRRASRSTSPTGGFLEWAEFLGHLYGTPLPDAAAGHATCVLEIDLQGARQVRDRHPDALIVLLAAALARGPGRAAAQPGRRRRRGRPPHRHGAPRRSGWAGR